MEEKKKIQEERNIISQINIVEVSARDMFLENYCQCSLCGTELIFTHSVDYHYNDVDEEAHCPHCNIRLKKNKHSLQ